MVHVFNLMKYQYTTYLPEGIRGKFIKRPMVEIEIMGPNGRHKQLALVDSGADYSIFSAEIAKYLGIDLERGRTSLVTGITGRTSVVMVDVEVKIEHLDSSMIPVGFIDSPHVGALLGQEGFFDGHRIKFEKDHNTFEVSRVRS